MKKEFDVGDRVAYVGKPVVNGAFPNAEEDLKAGLKGTVVKKDDIGPYKYYVEFDEHREGMIWPLAESEVDEPDTNTELSIENQLQIANVKLGLLKHVILALDADDMIDAYLDEIDMHFKFKVKDKYGDVVKEFDEVKNLKEFLDEITYFEPVST